MIPLDYPNLVIYLKDKAKKGLIAVLIVVLALGGYHYWHKHDVKVDKQITNPVLGPDQKEKIIVDPEKHTITVIKKNPDGSTTENKTYLPDHPTSITEDKNGKLTVESRKFGTEHRPYIGAGYSDAPRLYLGMDWFYYKKLDLGTGVGFNMEHLKDVRLEANVSYNIWNNTSLTVSYDNHKMVGGFVKLRF